MGLIRVVCMTLSCICFVAALYPALKMRTAPVGLTNVGSTCFMNAILQVMYITPMTPAFLALEDQCAPDGLLKAYRDFLINYNATVSGQVCNSQDFYTQLRDHKIFVTGAQGDSDEMLNTLFDRWGSQIEQVNKSLHDHCILPYKSLQFRTQAVKHCAKPSSLSGLWPAKRINEPEYTLFLPPAGSLEKILQNYFTEQEIKEYLGCDEPIKVVTRFFKLPLFFYGGIKLTQYDAQKREVKAYQAISIPALIDLAPYCTQELLATHVATRYHLIGVVGHQGASPRSGHYVSCVRYKTGPKIQWYICNDSNVAPISTETILDDLAKKGQFAGGFTPALLFYEQEKGDEYISDFERELRLIETVARLRA